MYLRGRSFCAADSFFLRNTNDLGPALPNHPRLSDLQFCFPSGRSVAENHHYLEHAKLAKPGGLLCNLSAAASGPANGGRAADEDRHDYLRKHRCVPSVRWVSSVENVRTSFFIVSWTLVPGHFKLHPHQGKSWHLVEKCCWFVSRSNPAPARCARGLPNAT